MVKVSVIIPVYNTEQYVCRCIDSVLRQTWQNFELIAVDDGSTDRSSRLLDEYARNDTRLIVIHQKNQGVSSARNQGLAKASGESITFVDSDDWLHPQYLEVLMDILLKSKKDMAICGVEYVSTECSNDYSLSNEYSILHKTEYMDNWMVTNLMGGRIYNRNCINGVMFSNIENEDTIFNFDIFAHNPQMVIAATNSKGYYYFQRADSRQSELMASENKYLKYLHHAEYYYAQFLREDQPDIKKTYLLWARANALQFLARRNQRRELAIKYSQELRTVMKKIKEALPTVGVNSKIIIRFSIYYYFPFLYSFNMWLHKNN